MSNPSKAKGTRYENSLLKRLRMTFGPQVERAPLKGIHDVGDFVGVPVPVEAKNTEVLKLPEWARRLNLACGNCWTLFWSGGDGRRKNCPGELMIVPADLGIYLLQLYANAEGSGCDLPTK